MLTQLCTCETYVYCAAKLSHFSFSVIVLHQVDHDKLVTYTCTFRSQNFRHCLPAVALQR